MHVIFKINEINDMIETFLRKAFVLRLFPEYHLHAQIRIISNNFSIFFVFHSFDTHTFLHDTISFTNILHYLFLCMYNVIWQLALEIISCVYIWTFNLLIFWVTQMIIILIVWIIYYRWYIDTPLELKMIRWFSRLCNAIINIFHIYKLPLVFFAKTCDFDRYSPLTFISQSF